MRSWFPKNRRSTRFGPTPRQASKSSKETFKHTWRTTTTSKPNQCKRDRCADRSQKLFRRDHVFTRRTLSRYTFRTIVSLIFYQRPRGRNAFTTVRTVTKPLRVLRHGKGMEGACDSRPSRRNSAAHKNKGLVVVISDHYLRSLLRTGTGGGGVSAIPCHPLRGIPADQDSAVEMLLLGEGIRR